MPPKSTYFYPKPRTGMVLPDPRLIRLLRLPRSRRLQELPGSTQRLLPVDRHGDGRELTGVLEVPGRRPMPGNYVAMLALSAVLGLVVITVGSITTGSRLVLAVVGAVAGAPAAFVIITGGFRSP